MAGRAKENLPGGSLKYLLVYLKFRLFKCSYRIYIYSSVCVCVHYCISLKRSVRKLVYHHHVVASTDLFTQWNVLQGVFNEMTSGSQAAGHCVGHGMSRQFARIPWYVFMLHIYITGWRFGTWILFFHILGIVIPTDFHIFQRGWNHQPDAYLYIFMYLLMYSNYDTIV